MSRFVEKLLDGAVVAWVPLGDESVGEFVRGGMLQKKDFTETGVGCIHYGQLHTHYGTSADETKSFVSEELAKKTHKAKTGNLVIATTSENDKDVCKAVAWLGSKDIAVSNDACIYKHDLNPKYVSYFFQTENFQSQKRPYITGTKVRRVNVSNLAKIVIPIPCPDDPEKSLAIQAEIVRILDAFTELTAELTAELTMRKKQYNYYRDQLLDFTTPPASGRHPSSGGGPPRPNGHPSEGGEYPFLAKLLDGEEVAWVPLGTLGELVRGNGLPKSDFTETGVPAIHYGQIYTFYGLSTQATISFVSPETATNLKKVNKGDVVMTNTSENVEDVGTPLVYLGEKQAVTGGHATIFKPGELILGMYFAYFTQTPEFTFAKGKYAKGTKVIDVSAKDMAKIPVPIPCPDDPEKSLAIQAEIVSILDKFDALTNSIREGLPREIELRQQQYEYYRDQLLNFPKPTSPPVEGCP